VKTVAVVALQDVVPFDIGVACDVFSRVKLTSGENAYRILVCSESTRVRAGLFDIRAPWRLNKIKEADIIIVPGLEDLSRPVPLPVIRLLNSASERGAIIASICTGAFVLAAAGLLNGRPATTHWAAANELSRRYPAIMVDADVLFVDDGNVITSAGASAGLDMCFHLIGREHGQAIAAQSARLAVAPLYRDGGQAQFIHQYVPTSESSLTPLFEWMLENLEKPLDVPALAMRARMSPRSFARRFREQTGTTPLQWLLKLRIRRAQELLEISSASVDQIAAASGFDSPVTFRARFQRLIGLTPSAYRRSFSVPDAAPGVTKRIG